ncbi:MAG TPA: hypothetical protein VNQ31_09740 [Sphingomonadaceae bacterium]|nr:hypothetical protein [Sphingomonadaceae bacterium]
MFQPGMEAQSGRSRKVEPARKQIVGDGRSLGGVRCLPDRQRRRAALQGVGVGFFGNPPPLICGDARGPPGRLPQTAFPKGGDLIALVAAGMAAHQHHAILGRADRKARASILMHRAEGHP